MTLLSGHRDSVELDNRLSRAHALTADLVWDVVGQTCRRFPPVRPTEKTQRIERLIGSGAWLDAVLALIDLELPQWQVRRIAYDEGEWHCALSRARELPDWLDQSIEAHHEDLPLAVLSAFVEARRADAPARRTSVPNVPRGAELSCMPFCCDNFA
jgi:hypothetical protein